MILMNTTFHWRNHITNLLSQEFLELCKAHLKPGGVMYYNTTGSEAVRYTASRVFQHVVQYDRFVAASDSPFTLTFQERLENMHRFIFDDQSVFDKNRPAAEHIFKRLASVSLTDESKALRRRQDLWLITDNNMATEFKPVKGFFRPEFSWRRVFKKLGWSWQGGVN
jgi:spermidine synthase